MKNGEPNIGLLAVGFFALIVVIDYARKLKEPRSGVRRVERRPSTHGFGRRLSTRPRIRRDVRRER